MKVHSRQKSVGANLNKHVESVKENVDIKLKKQNQTMTHILGL